METSLAPPVEVLVPETVSVGAEVLSIVGIEVVQEPLEQSTQPDISKRYRSLTRTNESSDPLARYYYEIRKIPLLTREQEIELSKRVKASAAAAEEQELQKGHLSQDEASKLEQIINDGKQAKDDFITANLRLVVSIAKKFQGSGLALLDLIQEGNIGLTTAVEKFDWQRGFKFSTYATRWIWQSLQKAIANYSRPIRLPVHQHNAIKSIHNTTNSLTARLNRDPNMAEIALEADKPEPATRMLLNYDSSYSKVKSLDELLGEDSKTKLGDVVGDPNAQPPYEQAETRVANLGLFGDVKNLLTDREFTIIAYRHGKITGQVETLETIGKIVRLNRERVRQIESVAMEKLRNPDNHLEERYDVGL